MISFSYLIEKVKEFFRPKLKLAPPMPKQRKKPAAKKTPAKKTATKKVSK